VTAGKSREKCYTDLPCLKCSWFIEKLLVVYCGIYDTRLTPCPLKEVSPSQRLSTIEYMSPGHKEHSMCQLDKNINSPLVVDVVRVYDMYCQLLWYLESKINVLKRLEHSTYSISLNVQPGSKTLPHI
jgi:hypothetical protein